VITRAGLLRWGPFPAAILLIFIVLVALDINGTSIAYLSADPHSDGLLAGVARGIRSDEWIHTTPLRVSAALQGFPSEMWVGLAPIDQAGPQGSMVVLDWSTLLRPDNWGFILLGASRGVAWAWWWTVAVGLWGLYAFIGVITRRPLLSAALATAGALTPYAAWWSNSTLTIIGYGAATGALIIAAWSAKRTWSAALYAVGAGLTGAAFALILYPPWQVPVIWVIGAAVIGLAIDRRLGWRRTLWSGGVTAIIAVAIFLAWYIQHRAAFLALAGTYYPGSRQSTGGGTELHYMLDAPLNPWLARGPGETLASQNLSEVASMWIPAAFLLCVIAGTIWLLIPARRGRDRADVEAPRVTLALLCGSVLLLLAWALLPLPSWVGSITFLGLTPAERVQVGIGLAIVLLTAAAATVRPIPPLWRWPAAIVTSVITAVIAIWTSRAIDWDASAVPIVLVAASGLVVGAGFAFTLSSRRWGVIAAGGLALYSIASWALVNPIQLGIAPLQSDQSIARLAELAKDEGNPRVMVFGRTTDFMPIARVRGAGLQSVSGWTPYPDAELMKVLAPDQEQLWNNYAQYAWRAAPAGSGIKISWATEWESSLNWLDVDPCMPELLDGVDPGWAVSDAPLDAACLTDVTDQVGGDGLWFYRVG
jgi:hypothetical protein